MRIYTPLDLRNIKDIYTRAAFRRLDQWLRDLAGNLSPSQAGSVANTVQVILGQLGTPTTPSFKRFDDFYRQLTSTEDLTLQPADGFEWKYFTSGVPTIKDINTLADTTYPDTGIWRITLGTVTGDYLFVDMGNNGGGGPLKILSRLRPGTEITAGIGLPSVGASNWHFGVEYQGGGNTYNPDACCRLLYFVDGQDYDFPLGFSVNYHGIANKQNFVALQINTLAGGKDLYGLGSTAAFAAISATKIPKATLRFDAGSANPNTRNKVTLTVEGVGTVTVDDVFPEGNVVFGGRVRGSAVAPGSQNGYFDYIGMEILAP